MKMAGHIQRSFLFHTSSAPKSNSAGVNRFRGRAKVGGAALSPATPLRYRFNRLARAKWGRLPKTERGARHTAPAEGVPSLVTPGCWSIPTGTNHGNNAAKMGKHGSNSFELSTSGMKNHNRAMARAFARQRFRLVFRRISTAYPQGRFSGCVSVYMGLLRNRSQAQKNPPG